MKQLQFPRGGHRHGKHRLSYTPEYRAWQQMRLRCHDPKHAAYPNYGARGIYVCERWLKSPTAFLADMGKKPSPKHELDRIDNDGPYSPENCRWSTRSENDRNRRNNRVVEHNGEALTLVAWSERAGVPQDTLKNRLDVGWSVERALTTPVRGKRSARQALVRANLAGEQVEERAAD